MKSKSNKKPSIQQKLQYSRPYLNLIEDFYSSKMGKMKFVYNFELNVQSYFIIMKTCLGKTEILLLASFKQR